MRTIVTLVGVFMLGGIICFGFEDEREAPKLPGKANAPSAVRTEKKSVEAGKRGAADKADADASPRTAEKSPATPPVNAKRTADEDAIRQADAAFVAAYEQGDAKAIAALFTADAEYVDELGNVSQGREAIEESLKEFFTENKGCKLEMNVDTIRFISPGVALEDGTTTITRPESSAPADSRYTAVYVKLDGKWLAASIRDQAPKNRKQHRAQLQQLDWLVGDWIDEGDDSVVIFSCKPVDKGNFLLRTFTIQVEGREVMSGTQRIGWDPLTGKLRAWIFDSEGAYGEGFWYRDGQDWVLKITGVTADGQNASSTSIHSFVNNDTMTWQSVHYEIAGVQQPDSEVVTIVRQAPAPGTDVAEGRE